MDFIHDISHKLVASDSSRGTDSAGIMKARLKLYSLTVQQQYLTRQDFALSSTTENDENENSAPPSDLKIALIDSECLKKQFYAGLVAKSLSKEKSTCQGDSG